MELEQPKPPEQMCSGLESPEGPADQRRVSPRKEAGMLSIFALTAHTLKVPYSVPDSTALEWQEKTTQKLRGWWIDWKVLFYAWNGKSGYIHFEERYLRRLVITFKHIKIILQRLEDICCPWRKEQKRHTHTQVDSGGVREASQSGQAWDETKEAVPRLPLGPL